MATRADTTSPPPAEEDLARRKPLHIEQAEVGGEGILQRCWEGIFRCQTIFETQYGKAGGP
jgi:hypothetical protein